jgi:opacity protein-like surface antigen
VAIHVTTWLAGEANVAGYYKTIDILNVGTFAFHDYAMMGGPRFNIRKAFFHGLVGVDHLTGSTNFYTASASSSDNALAGAAGGGVQWNVSRQLALRTSADYVLSRFGGLTQNNFRVTLGIVFEAGSVTRRGL